MLFMHFVIDHSHIFEFDIICFTGVIPLRWGKRSPFL